MIHGERFSIKQMMVVIAVVSFGFLAFSQDTEPFALLWLDVILFTVFAATLGALFSNGRPRAANVGYALGVVGYLYLMTDANAYLATSAITVPLGKLITGGDAGRIVWGKSNYNFGSFNCHLFIAITIGFAGSLIAQRHFTKSQETKPQTR